MWIEGSLCSDMVTGSVTQQRCGVCELKLSTKSRVRQKLIECVSPTFIGQFTSHDMSHDVFTIMSSIHPCLPPLRVVKSVPSQPLKAMTPQN